MMFVTIVNLLLANADSEMELRKLRNLEAADNEKCAAECTEIGIRNPSAEKADGDSEGNDITCSCEKESEEKGELLNVLKEKGDPNYTPRQAGTGEWFEGGCKEKGFTHRCVILAPEKVMDAWPDEDKVKDACKNYCTTEVTDKVITGVQFTPQLKKRGYDPNRRFKGRTQVCRCFYMNKMTGTYINDNEKENKCMILKDPEEDDTQGGGGDLQIEPGQIEPVEIPEIEEAEEVSVTVPEISDAVPEIEEAKVPEIEEVEEVSVTVPENKCKHNTCHYRGKCVRSSVDPKGYKCKCRAILGYGGEHCDTKLDSCRSGTLKLKPNEECVCKSWKKEFDHTNEICKGHETIEFMCKKSGKKRKCLIKNGSACKKDAQCYYGDCDWNAMKGMKVCC